MSQNNIVAAITGTILGTTKFIASITLVEAFSTQIFHTITIAFLGGLFGYLGKVFLDLIASLFKKKDFKEFVLSLLKIKSK